MMEPIRKFEIWIADLEPSFESEPGKTRPVVIIQSNFINQLKHTSYLICPISSQQRTTKGKLRIFTKSTPLNGLNKDSYILADQIRSVDIKRLKEKVGSINEDTAKLLTESIKILLDF